ncbi:MAG TPA: HlyD family efflux transporter periplasmic adaptor subunit [Microvirga sp.]|nr:HlyD family efflux transporter periplasmic adaptor subunit [Microvirga sp.]
MPEKQVVTGFPPIQVRGRLEPIAGILSLGAFSTAPTVAVGELLVEPGEIVTTGQVLATLRNRELALAEVAAAQASLDLAERRLAQTRRPFREATLEALRAAIDARQAELSLAQQQMSRTTDLQRTGVRTDADRDTRQAELRRAQALLREAEANLAATTSVAETEIRVAEGEVALARARLASSAAQAELALLRAPRPGTILRVHARSGEAVAGRAILDLADMTQLKAIAELDERLLPQIVPGTGARVAPRGIAREWDATILRIGGIVHGADRTPAEAAASRGGRFVEVELKIHDAAGLPPVAGLELLVRFSGS